MQRKLASWRSLQRNRSRDRLHGYVVPLYMYETIIHTNRRKSVKVFGLCHFSHITIWNQRITVNQSTNSEIWDLTGSLGQETQHLRPYVRRKSDLPLYISQIYAFYFDTTPNTLNDNVNTKSVWLNNLVDVCLQYCIETIWTMFQKVL